MRDEASVQGAVDQAVARGAVAIAAEHDCDAGVPLIQHAPKSKIQQSIVALAHALSGKNGKAGSKAAGGGGFWPWRK